MLRLGGTGMLRWHDDLSRITRQTLTGIVGCSDLDFDGRTRFETADCRFETCGRRRCLKFRIAGFLLVDAVAIRPSRRRPSGMNRAGPETALVLMRKRFPERNGARFTLETVSQAKRSPF